MFEDACDLLLPCVCHVGGCGPGVRGRIRGMGTHITDDMVLTARHVVAGAIDDEGCDDPAFMDHAGLWRCEVLMESEAADVAVLRKVDCVSDVGTGHPPPAKFPGLLGSRVTWGAPVGYFSRYRPADGTLCDMLFAAAALSFPTVKPHRWALSGGFAEEGFSGSAVFSPGGKILGVLTDIYRIAQPTPGKLAQLVTVPMMSPLNVLANELASLPGFSADPPTRRLVPRDDHGRRG